MCACARVRAQACLCAYQWPDAIGCAAQYRPPIDNRTALQWTRHQMRDHLPTIKWNTGARTLR